MKHARVDDTLLHSEAAPVFELAGADDEPLERPTRAAIEWVGQDWEPIDVAAIIAGQFRKENA